MSVDPLRVGEFRVGDVLARSWNIFIGNIGFFLGVTLLLYLVIVIGVGVVVGLAFLVGIGGDMGWLIVVGSFLAVLLFVGLNTIGEAVLLLGAFQRLRGEPLRVNEALQRAFARFFPLLGLGILSGLAILFGVLLLIVPGLILLCMWAVVVPVCIVESLGPTASMSRSSKLTKGHRWQIFGLLLMLWLINVIGSQFVERLFGLVSPTFASIGDFIWLAAWTAFWNCALIMVYHDLRVAKEGIDTEQIAAIFD